ncbi:MAG TPA: hypothetical protein VL128_07665 [Candidatus Eisenbacteria bacterium]|nr:hypothetical protein [Candidatus Eisenbacteria bacterium]
MKRLLPLFLILASCAFAQERANVLYRTSGAVSAFSLAGPLSPVVGAPYSATVISESVQTLADGTRIVQSNTGNMARDSQGRTRQDMPLPSIGNLSAANAPHLVVIHDPVAQLSYTLNLTDQTAQKLSTPPPPPLPAAASGSGSAPGGTVTMRVITGGTAPLPPDSVADTMAAPAGGLFIQKQVLGDDEAHTTTEDLGSQTMEGVLVTGVRTTHVIPAGEIGNDRPITIVSEVWTSPDLKTIVYSKRDDPRMGETTFRLTNVLRSEPDPALFTVPANFKVSDGPKPIIYTARP